MSNKLIGHEKGKCIGILYARKEDYTEGVGTRNAKVSIVDCRRTDRGSSDYEICVERELVGQGIEVRATGVTVKMLKKFAVGRDVGNEGRRAIIKFLTSGDEKKALNLSDEQLQTAARVFLEMGDETILEVKELGQVLDELGKYEELWVKGGMLGKEVLRDVLNWTSPSVKMGSANLLRVLGESPILCKGEDALVRNEIFKEILKSDYADEILIKLRRDPKLWERGGALNMVSLAIALNSKDPVSKIGELIATGGFKDISKLPVDELLRSVVMAIIGSDGRIDIERVDEVRKLVSIDDARHSAHVHRILDLLEKDGGFRKLIESVKAPRDTEGSGTVKGFIRIMLQMGDSEPVKKVDARRAVLQAVLSDLRQGNVGSCYGTAIAICVHDSIPHLMVKDLASMVEKGYFVRRRNTSGGEVKERFYIGENFDVRKELEIVGLKKEDMDIIMGDCAIKEDDLKEVEELKDLADKIKTLAVEASLNDDKELDKKVQKLINKYSEKESTLREKILNVNLYYKAISSLYKKFYVQIKGVSLLTKGWEYAIMSSELREIEREHEMSSTKIPPMMRELFKETLFNKDRGEVFITEMSGVLEKLQAQESTFDDEQKRQLSEYLQEIVEAMKSIVDSRITVVTCQPPGTNQTMHELAYAMGGKDVKKFKVLSNENGYSEAVLGCMMEAFEQVTKDGEMDGGVRNFLMNLKGMLGDKLQSKEFRMSVRSFAKNAGYDRLPDYKFSKDIYSRLDKPNRPGSVYFESAYVKNVLQIESNFPFQELLESIGYKTSVKDVDVGSYHFHVFNFFRSLGETGFSILMLSFIIAIIYDLFGRSLESTMVCLLVFLLGKIVQVTKRTGPASILVHFIEAGRQIYANVKNHDEWIKYPIGTPMHACTLMPFNESVRKIVESDEDIGQYVQRMIASPQKTTIAVMDQNYEGEDCYLGFELGGGSIRTVKLNAKFEVTGDVSIDTFKDVEIAETLYVNIDDRISEYNAGI